MDTSVGMDKATYKKLTKIANKYHRTLIGQIRFMVDNADD
jgi:hypothetical protein